MTITAIDAEIERVELAPAAALFRSLGDPARLTIVRRLAIAPARVTDLAAGLGLAQSTAEAVLAATGNSVALCPVWGTDCCDGDEP